MAQLLRCDGYGCCAATAGRRGFTRQPRVPALQTPPKFHEKTPKERKKTKMRAGQEKKTRKFGPPTLWEPRPSGPRPSGGNPGAPSFGGPPFGGPTLRGSHPSGAPPFGGPPFGGPPFGRTLRGHWSLFVVPMLFFCPECHFLFCPECCFGILKRCPVLPHIEFWSFFGHLIFSMFLPHNEFWPFFGHLIFSMFLPHNEFWPFLAPPPRP